MEQKVPQAATQPEAAWNDAPGLDLLYRRHAKWLAAALRRRFGRGFEAEADDIVQEAYARLAAQASVVHRPQALLMRMASNLARDVLRRRAVRGRHADDLLRGPSPASIMAGALDDLVVKETILSIPEPYRDVFVLSRFDGLTYEEIAARCGLSVKSVEWRLSKAVSHCLKRIQD
ncbi:RNA polymerase sigma factor [Caulobacter sp. UNC358MFTsu5.1]|uniref:RNA polymerase sigma factor n=1 Tax=Caulobacter sp. UNC358MFTsu5.1 TaxID=1449049 RepID=UPI00069158AE|nr:sigma-70 family RNA polymerase sigma factor [Caulobacter sp. UNC358MFTsu5.1]